MKMSLMLCAGLVACACSAMWAGEVEVPESFKGTVPLYPGATVVLSMKADEGTQVHLECPGKAKKVGDFYRKAMKEKGWIEGAFMEIPDGIIAAFQKGNQTLSVTAMQSENGKAKVTLALAGE